MGRSDGVMNDSALWESFGVSGRCFGKAPKILAFIGCIIMFDTTFWLALTSIIRLKRASQNRRLIRPEYIIRYGMEGR